MAGARIATEAMYLFAGWVLETLGHRRCEWKCDALNAPSRRAALRFGFTFEGHFRRAVIIRGRSRDTAWFSIIDEEWPALKGRLRAMACAGKLRRTGAQKDAAQRADGGGAGERAPAGVIPGRLSRNQAPVVNLGSVRSGVGVSWERRRPVRPFGDRPRRLQRQ